MAGIKQTRVSLDNDIALRVYTNPSKNIKGNTVRDRMHNLSASSLNIESDLNIVGGYLGIDINGRVDVSFIASASPSGRFLKDDGTWATVSTSPTWSDVLGNGNTSDGNDVVISLDDLITSGVGGKSIIGFGNNGDEINFFTDGGVGSESFLFLKPTYAQLGFSSGKSIYVDVSTLDLAHTTQLGFYSPSYYFDTATASKIAVFNSSKELVSGSISELDILTVATAGTTYIPVTGTGATHLNGIIEFDNISSESALSSSGTMVIGAGDDKDYNNANRFAYLQVSGNSTIQAMLKVNHTGVQAWVDLTGNGTIAGIEVGSNYSLFKGFVYSGDFSANYVPRSIPDVAFVQGVAALYIPLAGGTASGNILFSGGAGIDTTATVGSDVLNIGATNANVINYGNSSTVHNFLGTAIYELQVNAYVEDKLMTLNYGGAAASGIGVGYEIEEDGLITGYQKTNAARSGWSYKAPANTDYTDFVLSASVPRTKTFQDTTSTIAEYGDKLSVFSATTSAELASVISDETGFASGALLVFSKGPSIDAPVFSTSLNCTYATASTIAEFDGSKYLVSAAKGTAYNKNFGTGVANIVEIGATLGNSLIVATDASGKIVTLDSATYPSLSELIFVKGVASQLRGQSDTATLTNKRITPRVTTISSSATPTVNSDNCDAVDITALAVAATSMTSGLSGTPTNFQRLVYRIKDNGTARAITWGASFEALGVALPTTTTINKRLTVGFIYDTTTSKWGCVAALVEA